MKTILFCKQIIQGSIFKKYIWEDINNNKMGGGGLRILSFRWHCYYTLLLYCILSHFQHYLVFFLERKVANSGKFIFPYLCQNKCSSNGLLYSLKTPGDIRLCKKWVIVVRKLIAQHIFIPYRSSLLANKNLFCKNIKSYNFHRRLSQNDSFCADCDSEAEAENNGDSRRSRPASLESCKGNYLPEYWILQR